MGNVYQSKYFAHDLQRRSASDGDRLATALFDAAVDLNPHQIEAALFAVRSPLAKGVLLADEVGLGKTIEAGLVLCQMWAERKRKLLVICPASIRKQWQQELTEKFNLPTVVLDAKTWREAERAGVAPLAQRAIAVMSLQFVHKMREQVRGVAWDVVVVDEAHRLRNSYRTSNRLGQGIRWATEGRRKVLLTATPLQNSLVELYGLASLIDEQIFGDIDSFRGQFVNSGADLPALRRRLATFCTRTLRRDVTEYVRFTQRRAMTQPFSPNDREQALYDAVSSYLQRDNTLALPERQRHLTALVMRKLLASSSHAIAGTLEVLVARLKALQADQPVADSVADLIDFEDLEPGLLEDWTDDDDEVESVALTPQAVDRLKLGTEIAELTRLALAARSIGVDTRSKALLQALDSALKQMVEMGAAPKALVFTESRRTQRYLRDFLEAHGYSGRVLEFNGDNGDDRAQAIYDAWLLRHGGTARSSGSRGIDVRTALVEHFRDHATVMLATEAASEGVNLQFCSLVVNYDLPWNPQRIEQRIGRCHRYGQQHDVVVVNFLNERNQADQRVLQLLAQKFVLFDGVFGASDEILGSIESGVDLEKRILAIYQKCRTSDEISKAFETLQRDLEQQIHARLSETQRQLLDHFDADVHERLRLQLAHTSAQLDRVGKRFWAVTRHMLQGQAVFDDERLLFDLPKAPRPEIPAGRYHLVSKNSPAQQGDLSLAAHLYRLTHPLGEHVLQEAIEAATPTALLTFDVSHHPVRLHVVEAMRGQSGWLTLQRLAVRSLEDEEHLLFSGFLDSGASLDPEIFDKLFQCDAEVEPRAPEAATAEARLAAEAQVHRTATLHGIGERNLGAYKGAREQLDRWADDCMAGAEQRLVAVKEQIKALRRQQRLANTLDEQAGLAEQMRKLEASQRKQRQEIFAVEDDIARRRDQMDEQLKARLAQHSQYETLFTVRWVVV